MNIGDCLRRPNEQHTAVDIEGACIHGIGLITPIPQVCGECVFYRKRVEKKPQGGTAPQKGSG